MTTEISSTAMTRPMKVVLAEGNAQARDVLASQVAALAGVDLVATESNAADAIISTYRLHPDVVLLDLTPPDRPATDAIRHLLRVWPGVSVAILFDGEEDARLTPALDAGARESLPKSAPADRIESTLRRLGTIGTPEPGPN